MHLYTILAFAYVFWRADQSASWQIVGEHDVWLTLVIALGQPPLIGLGAALAARRASRLLKQHRQNPQIAQHAHHRAAFVLRLATVLGFGATVLLTRWPEWFELRTISPLLQVFGDWIVLTPFLASVVALWVGSYPLERDLRRQSLTVPGTPGPPHDKGWHFRAYLDFNLRHQVLIMAVPMLLILFAFNLTYGYEASLRRWTGWVWAPDVALGFVALSVFVMAPTMLRHIWRTHPLEPGPVRSRLEALCGRIGLKCRDILVWQSDGMVVNAAVMGVFAPVRFVMLSDGLLELMEPEQIEAVFGHEAGHVKHHHMQLFLIFALLGWILAAGVMELLLQANNGLTPESSLSMLAIEGAGFLTTVAFWGLGFGWVSRRFERQADLFGASCVTPPAGGCHLPCSVHVDRETIRRDSGRVCAAGAALFASALDRVAVLNGIPHDERSWRHSSIASRMRFLVSLAGDPLRARGFNRLVRGIKVGLVLATAIGAAAALYYYCF